MTNSLDEVSRLPLFLEEIAEETGMGMAEMMSLNVALEEALVNVTIMPTRRWRKER